MATAMTPAQIVVVKRGRNWHIKWTNSDRIFANGFAAVKGAIDAAHECGENGTPTCVMLFAGKSEMKGIWIEGRRF